MQKDLAKHQSKTLTSLQKQLFEAAKNRDVDKFKEITNKGIDPFTKDEFELPAIHYFILGKLSPEDARDIKYMLDIVIYKEELLYYTYAEIILLNNRHGERQRSHCKLEI